MSKKMLNWDRLAETEIRMAGIWRRCASCHSCKAFLYADEFVFLLDVYQDLACLPA
jgi:hypothetical protein